MNHYPVRSVQLSVTSEGTVVRRLRIVGLFVALLMVVAVPATARSAEYPDVIPLPGGFFPEGISLGEGSTAYVGSLVDGAIWKGDLRTGDGVILVPGVAGRLAVGMAYDRSSGNLFVAGGPGGNAYVYDGDSGETIAVVALGAGFINDVIVTNEAAYFTNSFAPEFYVLPLNRNGEIAGSPLTVPLGGDFQFVPGAFNANGIEASQSGDTLIVVNSAVGGIYTVDPVTGLATVIDLGGAVVNGDGLVLTGQTLYAVVGGANQVTKIELSPGFDSGVVVDSITSGAFVVPTTAAKFGNSLYTVNAKFGTPPLPSTPYEIVRVDR